MSEVVSEKTELVPLSELKAGEIGIIREYQMSGGLYSRLRELGLVRGTRVTVKRFAPFRDPMELVVRGYHLSLRKKDASYILVSRENGK